MSVPLVFHANMPPPDVTRLAELEELAKETGAQFYTLEVIPTRQITLAFHSKEIFSKRIKGDSTVTFEMVLDWALKELKEHILGKYTRTDEKPQ